MNKRTPPTTRQKNTTDRALAARKFLGSFIVDKTLLKQWVVFYNSNNGKYMDSILLQDYGRDYRIKQWEKIKIKLRSAAGQLISPTLDMEYPYLDKGDDITTVFRDLIITKWAMKHKLIDDEMLTIFRAIIAPFRIMYDWENVGLMPKEESKQIVSMDVLSVLNKEIELGYVNKEIWDMNAQRGYTHILRRNLQLNLQLWQKELLLNWKQFNYVAWSRRIGKTFTSGYIAKRELYRKGWGYWARERQILFICVSEEKMWQPLQYLLTMCKDDIALGYIKYTQKDKQFENTITWAKLIFRSAWSRTGAASYWADLVILDEAAMIPDSFWEDLLPIIIQEGATVFGISTINEDVKDNWFYRELVRAELEIGPNMYAQRVTIDDNELLSDERKEAMKKALENNPMKYWTQLYSIFPSGNNVFSLTGVIQPNMGTMSDTVVIWYDPGKISDNAWVVIIDPSEMRVIEEVRWYQVNYKDQKQLMIDLKKNYKNCTVVMDRTWVGEWVAEIFGDVVDVYVKYKGHWEVTFNTQFGYYQVSKMTLVEFTKLYFEHFGLKINSGLENLINELKWFQKINTGNKVIQYGGVWVKDDSVNALMLACFYLKYVAWITAKHQWIDINFNKSNNPSDFINWLFEYDDYNDSVYKRFNY